MQILFLLIIGFFLSISDHSIKVHDGKIDELISKYEYSLINFFVLWCKFCVVFEPEYDDAAEKINSKYSNVALIKVNCELQSDICQHYHVDKYPTVMVFRHGKPIKEYRSARKSEALVKYVLNDIQTEPKPIVSEDEIDKSKDYFLGKFLDHNTPQYIKFKEIISELHDDCVAFAIFHSDHHFPGHITFHPSANSGKNVSFSVDINILHKEFKEWSISNCRPLIKEITFSNAEALTADKIPLLILFYPPGDESIREVFKGVVEKHLSLLTGKLKPVYANAQNFKLALIKIGRSHEENKPIIAIDDYRHLYDFKEDFSKLSGQEFVMYINDFYSEKLHKELHEKQNHDMFGEFFKVIYGIDSRFPNIPNDKKIKTDTDFFQPDPSHKDHKEHPEHDSKKVISVFKNLTANELRYTMAREIDEL